MEKWKKIFIKGQETFYSVSSLGRVRNDSTKTFLEGNVSNNGYRMVHLRCRVDKVCSVHRLVMMAFAPRDNMEDLQVNHKNGIKTDNRLDNLEWCTALENMRHSFRMNLQKKQMRPCYQYDLEGNFLAEYENCRSAAVLLGIDHTNVWRCVTEQQGHYKQFQFKSYKKDKIHPWYNQNQKAIWVYRTSGEFIDKYESQKACAKAFDVAESSISRYVKGSRTLEGFIFSKIPL